MPLSTISHLLDVSSVEQICYVQCGFCNTILLVCVPYSSMSMVVTVRCGHCSSLLSVNMMKSSSLLPGHLDHPQGSKQPEEEEEEEVVMTREVEDELEGGSKGTLLLMNNSPPTMVTSSDDNEDEEDTNNTTRIINKPPEKRQRAPSAYNRFIKEEIKRLKSENPTMAHKDAFSMAAKNWAHFPPVQHRDGDDEIRLDEPQQVNIQGKH
ncbi:Axial regulator YABBY 4 [Linum perenne]